MSVLTMNEREDVERDLIGLFADLGRSLSTPAINEDAEQRRQEYLDNTRAEIARLQKLLYTTVPQETETP